MKTIIFIMISLFLLSCSLLFESKEYGITVNYTVINTLNEQVLVKDNNFSRGFIPVFISANDTFSFSQKYTWTMERDRSDVNTLAPKNKATYHFEVFRAGINNDFSVLDTFCLLGPDYPDDSLPDLSIEQDVQFYDTLIIQGE